MLHFPLVGDIVPNFPVAVIFKANESDLAVFLMNWPFKLLDVYAQDTTGPLRPWQPIGKGRRSTQLEQAVA